MSECFGTDIANMKDSWFFDNNFNGLSDDIFDDVVGFFDFPLEDVEDDWDSQFKCLEHQHSEVFSASSNGLCAKTQTENPQFGTEFSVSCNGISPIKQLATAPGPTYGKTIPLKNVTFNGKDLHRFRTYSPVSVFESSSSSSVENSSFDRPVIPVKRARSKRHRRISFSPLFSIPFVQALQKQQRTSASESDFGTNVAGNMSNKVKSHKKKDLSLLSEDVEIMRSSHLVSDPPRKCMHCEVTKTPQWREGPMGPKTLCNACGVRYRSGRLFPEYRPAASPTFVASLHSNCHKKVVEMRSRVQEGVRGSVFASSNLHENSVG
ncbi:GATA transcription factor 11 isoform X1 [Vigna radiata var. radiata]|uniref:GATA transcription factor 11 isoform X1 n=2 Tax=Vigna radiata var. radiata TaxID=3916 RepID=A0A1S3TWL4_VIGRR|nr:GATA transcription factor 11 isoform X1 [Vigna radiata var. radiata]